MRRADVLGALMLLLGVSATSTGEPRVAGLNVLKRKVIVYEPIYVTLRNVPSSEEWQRVKNSGRLPMAYLETRKRGTEPWLSCRFPSSDEHGPAKDIAVPEVVGPSIINRNDYFPQCEMSDVGDYEVRWLGGVSTTVTVLPIPKSEIESAALMSGKPVNESSSFVGNLASSVYAGYVMLNFFPSRPAGPVFVARDRQSYETRRATLGPASNDTVDRWLRAALAEHSRDAHPEFIFADEARLLLVDHLVFVGKCRAAGVQFGQVRAPAHLELARKYEDELRTVREQSNTICMD
jgi:hypothetical protein